MDQFKESEAGKSSPVQPQGGAPPAASRGSGFEVPSISLPKGGGAIRGIGEKFAANPVTGTGSMSVPISTSPGRSGFGPQLLLSYDSGAGNSPFGFGWNLSLPAITRKTDKGLPQYLDTIDSDIFILSGAEDLVPVYRQDHAGTRVAEHTGYQLDPEGLLVRDPEGRLVVHEDEIDGYRVRRYRPRIEGLFARIERWSKIDSPGDVHWRSISKDNILTIYGKDINARIADPDPNHAGHIFSWLICETRDDKGNAVIYTYKEENGVGVDLSQAHERNRGDKNDPRRSSNRYLKRIHYGNRTSLLDNAGKRPRFLTNTQIHNADWMFEVVFDYDDGDYTDLPLDVPTAEASQHRYVTCTPSETANWKSRPDPFSIYRSCFEVRTARLCQRILMFHHFSNEAEVGSNCLVRSTDFTYGYEQDPHNAKNPVYSRLVQVTQSGYKRDGAKYLKRSLPPVEFKYTEPKVQDRVEEVNAESLENLPVGVDGATYQWTDLHGEGIPGILTEQADAWFYKRNLSPRNDSNQVEFSPLERVASKPNLALAGGAQFMDLAGDGQPDLVVMEGPAPGLYEHDEAEGWQPFRPFTSRLNRNTHDPNLKFIDLDGDGHVDVLITEDNAFVWHASLAEEGFGPARRVTKALDEEKGPRIVFADGTQSIYLADLSGDNLTDIVRIRNGEVCYWPNLGYGRFGCKVTMDDAPWFDNPEQFDLKRIRLADIDGSGTTDIIYLHRDGVRLYFNQSGNSWSQPHTLMVFPRIDDLVNIAPADLLGNGTACLVWSSHLPGDARRPMKYINLTCGPSLFTVGDIKNLKSFVDKLLNPADAITQFVQQRLSNETITLLNTFDSSDSVSNQVADALTKDLSRVVKGELIYEAQRFVTVNLSQKTRELIALGPDCRPVTLLNLLLLEDAYPDELLRRDRVGQKPHLLISTKNNLGAETRVQYSPSTKFYLKDKQAGKPWRTRLPFPVHVVERVETWDHISKNRFITRYAYHHGFFDGAVDEREFRGFGMVEQWDTEEISAQGALIDADNSNWDAASSVPPVHTKTWFHTGVYLGRDRVSNFFAGLLDDKDTGEYYPSFRAGDAVSDATAKALLLDDTILPSGLSLEEEREACRALKGSMLRQEVYAEDNTDKAKHPYTVTEQNFTIKRLQPRDANRHAVFFTHPREALTYHYERNPADPRIQHALTLEVDDYGNVRKSLAIGYGRKAGLSPLQGRDKEKQEQTHITYTENVVTNAIDDSQKNSDGSVKYPADYRTPLPCDIRTYEVTGLQLRANAERIVFEDLVADDFAALVGLEEAAYEEPIDYSVARKRCIEHVRTRYRKDNLAGLLPPGKIQPLALPGESYKLAFTPGLAKKVYVDSGKLKREELDAALADDGGYVHFQGDANWWIPSGRIFYSGGAGDDTATEWAEAIAHFYQPRRYQDPFGQDSFVDYDYDLLLKETRYPLGNRVTVEFNDYRVLQPRLVSDPNRNQTEFAFDALGLVVGTAVMGKPPPAPKEGDTLDNFVADLEQAKRDEFMEAPCRPSPSDQKRSEATDIVHELLQGATTRIVYDLDRFRRLGEPPFAATIARETHVSDLMQNEKSKLQVSFSYSDGFGREIQKKVQAEPGKLDMNNPQAPIVNPRWVGSGWTIFNNKGKPVRQYEPFFSKRQHPDGTSYSDHHFEFGVTIGVSPVLFYDPLERVVATLHPNHTYEKVVFDPWRQFTHDVNDTLRKSDAGRLPYNPKDDPDVGHFFSRLPDGDYLPTWYDWRTDPGKARQAWPDADEQGRALPDNVKRRAAEESAAKKAVRHADTPTIAHFDALGRPFLTFAHNRVVCADHPDDGKDEQYATRTDWDIEGNQRAARDAITKAWDTQGKEVFDELGRIVMCYDYHMAGPEKDDNGRNTVSNRIYQISMEAGARWTLNDVTGKPIHAWDSRGHHFMTTYDVLRRTLAQYVQGTTADSDPRTRQDSPLLVDKIEYGEPPTNATQADLDRALALNLRTRIYRHHDSAGIVTNAQFDANGKPAKAYDFKGNLLASTRQLASDYTAIPDWSQNPKVDNETFTGSTRYDALNRPIQSVAPHSSLTRPGHPNKFNVIQHVFNEANLLERVDVWLERAADPPDLLDSHAEPPSPVTGVADLDYDAKGQRLRIDYKNGSSTRYTYDPDTFRLLRLRTVRGKKTAADCAPALLPRTCEDPPYVCRRLAEYSCVVQDLKYVYDPAGNITHIKDDAQQIIYFRERLVEACNDYTFDSTYRLIEARGREHLGQNNAPIPHSSDDALRTRLLHPGDGNAMGTYVERYTYDAVGNFREMRHHRTDDQVPDWRRTYTYEEPSLIEDGADGSLRKVSNRLSHTTMNPNRPSAQTEPYQHDAHGNIIDMPHLSRMAWNYKDELLATARQVVNDTPPPDSFTNGTYYVYDSSGQRVRKVCQKGQGLTEECIYLGGFEIYRKHNGAIGDDTAILERETLHVMDDKQRVALVETRTLDIAGNDQASRQLIRYQFDNHLGSASVELDGQALIVSYEEYAPYGSSTYQAERSHTEIAKRYRYTGKERDEDCGLYYHGARYYAAWSGRWISTDPIGMAAGVNIYAYVHGNPTIRMDSSGLQDIYNQKTESDAQTKPTKVVPESQDEDVDTSKKIIEGDINAINTYKTWLVENPSKYRYSIVAKLEKDTEVVVIDGGKGKRFNETDIKFKWQKVRVVSGPHKGKEGWVMSYLIDRIETNEKVENNGTNEPNETLSDDSGNVENKSEYAHEYLEINMKITPGGASYQWIALGKSIPEFFEKSGLGGWDDKLRRNSRSKSMVTQLVTGLEAIPFAICVATVSAYALAYDAVTGTISVVSGGLLFTTKDNRSR